MKKNIRDVFIKNEFIGNVLLNSIGTPIDGNAMRVVNLLIMDTEVSKRSKLLKTLSEGGIFDNFEFRLIDHKFSANHIKSIFDKFNVDNKDIKLQILYDLKKTEMENLEELLNVYEVQFKVYRTLISENTSNIRSSMTAKLDI